MKEFEYNDKIIEDLGLTEMQILNIYQCGITKLTKLIKIKKAKKHYNS
jgi:hypothetical protein